MKKSIILSIIACCAAFTSCNMDEMPSTSIPTDESILTVKDCQAFSNMLHAEWRGYVQNAYSMDALVQSGLLTATADYGNTYGYFYRWAFEITDGAFSGCWADNYYIIANANHLIKGGQNILANDTELSENDKAYINHYVGQAYFPELMLILNWPCIIVRTTIPHLPEVIMEYLWLQNMRLVRIIPNIPVVAA